MSEHDPYYPPPGAPSDRPSIEPSAAPATGTPSTSGPHGAALPAPGWADLPAWAGGPGRGAPPAPGPTAWSPPPGLPGPTGHPGWAPSRPVAAHRPGAVPLRPLRLSDLLDGAFRIVRRNPRATVGSAVAVASVAMAIPLVVVSLVTFTVGATITTDDQGLATDDVLGVSLAIGSYVLGVLLLQVGLTLVTAVVARVTHAAAVGRTLSMGEAWAEIRGRRLRVVGLMLTTVALFLALFLVAVLVIVVVAVVTGSGVATVLLALFGGLFVLLPVVVFVSIRLLYLAPTALVLEDLGVFAALGRSYRLTARAFWRTFGIALLVAVMATVAGNLIGTPASIVGQVVATVKPEYALLALAVSQAVAAIAAAAIAAPFKAAVASLQYLDQRMRKEAYDVDLMTQAGLL